MIEPLAKRFWHGCGFWSAIWGGAAATNAQRDLMLAQAMLTYAANPAAAKTMEEMAASYEDGAGDGLAYVSRRDAGR